MPIKVTCPSCETVNTAADEKAGKRIRCKECEEPISVPAAGAKKKSGKAKDEVTPKKGSSGLLLAIGGGIVLVLLLCVGVGVGGYFLIPWKGGNDATKGGPQAKNKDSGLQPKKKPEPKPPVEIKTSVPGESAGLAVTPDGRVAIVMGLGGTKKNVEIWDLQKKAKLHDFSGGRHMHGVTISADGKSAAFTNAAGTATRIDVESGQETELKFTPFPIPAITARVCFSPDGDTLYLAADRRVLAWDKKGKGRIAWNTSSTIESVSAFFNEGKNLATGGTNGTIQIWEVGSPNAIRTLTHKGKNPVNCMVSSDGKTLLSVTRLGRDLMVWDLGNDSKRDVSLSEATSHKCPPALTPDGKTMAYATGKNNIVLVNINTGQPDYELKRHTQEITALAISADGSRLFSLGRDNTLNIWDIQDLK